MKFSKSNFLCACVIGLVLIAPAYTAPRKRSKGHSSTTYDQNQSGDYNIQVRLKDFHIIAVLGDDFLGGDYDYNYDYSDLTIKPIVPITTANPQDSETTEDVQKPETDTEKPSDHPYPIVSPSTTVQSSEKPTSSSTTPLTAISVSIVTSEPLLNNNRSENVTIQKSDAQSTENPSTTTKDQLPQKSTKLENSSGAQGEAYDKKTESSVTNISIVPVEHTATGQNDQRVALGEIMHYRKCSDGFAKDKQGRCRKIIRRTPQLPFGITRFASNLASRFRQATSGDSSLPDIH